MIQARHNAAGYALTRWHPAGMLPSYSAATRWDGINQNSCFRFASHHWRCSVGVYASDYRTDPNTGESTGYAWCVGNLDVFKSSRGPRVFVHDTHDETCDSTNDYGP